MLIIKLKDKSVEHEPSFLNHQDKIKISKDDIEDGDITIYTDLCLKKINKKSKYNIACLFETPLIIKDIYSYVENNYNKFDIVLTYYKKFLDLDNNKFKLQLFGTTWINEAYRKIYRKNKICSIIASNKKKTVGHKLRHYIIDYFINNNIKNIDFYGGRFKNLSYTTTTPYTIEHSGSDITNQKINGLKDYMFSIVIENTKCDYYFSEKLIDCFLTGTIPIYWGCPSINKFFNSNGIISFDTLEECIKIINTLNEQKYLEMLPFIKENFEKAKNYVYYKINEDAIFELINE